MSPLRVLVFSSLFSSPATSFAASTPTKCSEAHDRAGDLLADHRLRAARSQFLICASEECDPDDAHLCSTKVTELDSAIPTIVFGVKNAAGIDLSAVKVTMDGEVLTAKIDGTPLLVDPGRHTFRFEVQGEQPLDREFVIQQSDRNRIERLVVGKQASPTKLPPRRENTSMNTQRILALVSGGVGLVGVGLGSYFGVQAVSRKDTAEKVCPRDPCDDSDGNNAWISAGKSADRATVAFIVAGAFLTGGVALWLMDNPRSTQVGVGFGSLALGGRW